MSTTGSKSASTEAAARADFSYIRYAQVWEDADVLLDALDVREGDVCLSIASAGDNAFSLLIKNPSKVIAVDLNPAQLACVELRKAAYRVLEHPELLQLVGSRPCDDRLSLYQRCRREMPEDAQRFWNAHPDQIAAGIGSAGKFERYFSLFRTRILPLVHSRKKVDQLLAGGTLEQRRDFYRRKWNTFRWRLLFKIFFSRRVMGKAGRDPAFFRYVEGSVADRIFARSQHALSELNPAENPYLQWILTGTHTTALPHALRAENFDLIRRNLDRLEVRLGSIEEHLAVDPRLKFDRFNLSDIFEYMSNDNAAQLMQLLALHANPKARFAYWNMLVPRSRPAPLAGKVEAVGNLGDELLMKDKAFFYSRFVVEELLSEANRA